MCRLAAYHGPRVALEEFLLKPEHSLVVQSWAPREMVEARLNADGFGFGWFDEDGRPLRYRNAVPIWSDPNLPELGRGLKSDTWLGVVRSATPSIPINLSNTMPYSDDRFHFTHNGYIHKFSQTLRSCLRRELKPDFEDQIEGNTDSEHLFVLLKQLMWESGSDDPASGLMEMTARLKKWLKDERALLNIVIVQPGKIWAMRYAINGNCPSLYYSLNPPSFPGASLIASEPLSADEDWTEFAPQSLMVFEGINEPEHIHP